MDTNDQLQDLSTDDQREQQREVLRQSLDDLVHEIGTALREANLSYPMFLAIPHTGPSLATIATPVDPTDDDEWSRRVTVACKIIEKALGIRVSNRGLVCAAINTAMSATDLTTD